MTEGCGVHITALNGSPHRNGNTTTLMRWVLEGCEETGASTEWIHIVDHEIKYCRGCFTCLQTGVCPIEDDFLGVRDRLLAADGIVVGSPVYEGQPTAQVKTFLDRLTLLNLYTDTFERQRSVGVATSGVAPTAGVAKGLAVFFGRQCGTIGAKTASVKRGYQSLAEVHNPQLVRRAHALGRRLVGAVRNAGKRPSLSVEQIWFRILRTVVVRPLVLNNSKQFEGVIEIWKEKGWL